MDYPSNDLTQKPTDSVTECLAFCRQTPGCKVFVWHKTLKNCWLKTKRGESKYDTNFISGPICGE